VKLKIVVASVAGVVALAMMAGPAFADCVNVSRPDKANVQIAAHSPAVSPDSCLYEAITPCTPHLTLDNLLLLEFGLPASVVGPLGLGLCPQGAQYLVDQIHAAAALPGSGIDLTLVVGGLALQSGGQLNASNPRVQQNLFNGKGIDLLGANAEILAVIEANIAAAAALCP
jgi:hypothetical protein